MLITSENKQSKNCKIAKKNARWHFIEKENKKMYSIAWVLKEHERTCICTSSTSNSYVCMYIYVWAFPLYGLRRCSSAECMSGITTSI